MKKIILSLALVLALVACSKQRDDVQAKAEPEATGQKYFSHVQYFKDGRKPSTDTIWTLQLFNQQMVDSFSKYDGKVYWESTIAKEIGVLWTK